MFDVGWSEFVLVAFVALIVIGPKDLPKAMRVLGYWVGRARAVGRQFRAGFDEMVREAEVAEMEKKWKEENERIMREFAANEQAAPPPADDGADAGAAPVTVEKPVVAPADADQPSLFAEPQTPPPAAVDGKAPS